MDLTEEEKAAARDLLEDVLPLGAVAPRVAGCTRCRRRQTIAFGRCLG
jgi:hypothetical protein